MNVCVIGGGGTIGSTLAYTLAVRAPDIDVTLLDVDRPLAEAHAMDIRHATYHLGHPVGRPSHPTGGPGRIETDTPGPRAVDGADCLVVTASAPRPPGGSQRGGRMTFLERNREIAAEIGTWLREVDPRPLVCVTNPMDRIAYSLWEACEWPRTSIIGYSLSEEARLADWFARRFDTSPAVVSCPIVGEHGEYIVPVFSRATIDGESVSVSETDRRAALDFVRDAPYDIIQARGPEHSSRWVTAQGVGLLVERILRDDLDHPVCLSVPLDGEYGYEDVCLSVPIALTDDGWSEIYEWDLSTWERRRFDAAYRAVYDSLHG